MATSTEESEPGNIPRERIPKFITRPHRQKMSHEDERKRRTVLGMKWKHEHPRIVKHSNLLYYLNMRYSAFLRLCNGGDIKCARCGCDNWKILQINHKERNGGIELKLWGYAGIIRSIAIGFRKINDLELLCKDCHKEFHRNDANKFHGNQYVPTIHGKFPPYYRKWALSILNEWEKKQWRGKSPKLKLTR